MHKYFFIGLLSFSSALKNKKTLIGLGLILFISLTIFSYIFQALAIDETITTLSQHQLFWYLACNLWVVFSFPDLHIEMMHDIKTGRFAHLLPQPISYLGSIFAKGYGTFLARFLFFGISTFFFAYIKTQNMPLSLGGLMILTICTLLSGVIAVFLQMIVGFLSFWVHEIDPFYWIVEKLLLVWGGLMLPLVAYPVWMQKISYLTPFSLILGERSALVLSSSFTQVVTLLLSYMGWGAILFGILLFLYRKGLQIVHSQGR